MNYSLKVEVWSTKARKFSGIEAIRRIVIMKSAARRTREKAPLPPAPNPLFRYFPNTERGRCSLSSAAVSSTGYLTTRGIKRVKEGRNCRLTLSFPTCRALDSSRWNHPPWIMKLCQPPSREGERKKREGKKGRENRRERKGNGKERKGNFESEFSSGERGRG